MSTNGSICLLSNKGRYISCTSEFIWIIQFPCMETKSVKLQRIMRVSSSLFFWFMVLVLLTGSDISYAAEDPTHGFTNVPLTAANLVLQKPYDIPLNQRYSFKDGVHRMWVYADDKPHDPTSHTQPRTEIRITGLDYSSGVWQFEGFAFVPNGTSGATIVQIHGAAHGATTIILRIYDGNMRYYSSDLVDTDLYDKWFKVNLIHDVDEGKVTVFIDDEQKFQTHDQGPGNLYFKCGVYAAPANISYYMESRWRDIKIYKK